MSMHRGGKKLQLIVSKPWDMEGLPHPPEASLADSRASWVHTAASSSCILKSLSELLKKGMRTSVPTEERQQAS